MGNGQSTLKRESVVTNKDSLQAEEKRNLRRRTKDFALRIIHLYSSLPRTTQAQVLGK
jgi:hypothetical protein